MINNMKGKKQAPITSTPTTIETDKRELRGELLKDKLIKRLINRNLFRATSKLM